MTQVDDLQAQIDELRAMIMHVAKGDGLKAKPSGIRIGSKRIVADADHLYQEDADGTKTRLDVT